MRQRRNKMQPHEKVPATFRIPLLPKLTSDDLKSESLGPTPPREAFSKLTNAADAEHNRRAAISNCLDRLARRDRRALEELLELGEGFSHDPQLVDAMRDVILAARTAKKRAGRPPGLKPKDHERSLRITRIAEGFRAAGITLEAVFGAMEKHNFERIPDLTRRNYYKRGRKHPAMQAHLFTPGNVSLFAGGPSGVDESYVFVPERLRIEPAGAVPEGSRVTVSASLVDGIVNFQVTIEPPTV